MGCSVFCKISKEKEIIKSEINKEFLQNSEPIIVNIEKTETQKESIKEKQVEMNKKSKQIILSINKGNISERKNNLMNQTPKTNKDQILTNFTSQIKDIQKIGEKITPEDEEILKTIFHEHFLFKKGDEGSEFYIIKKGKILIITEYGDKYLKEGDTFGEIALMHNGKRTATAITIEKCELFLLNGLYLKT